MLIAAISAKGNPYIKIYEDVADRCKPITQDSTEFKGYITIAYTDAPVQRKKKNI